MWGWGQVGKCYEQKWKKAVALEGWALMFWQGDQGKPEEVAFEPQVSRGNRAGLMVSLIKGP